MKTNVLKYYKTINANEYKVYVPVLMAVGADGMMRPVQLLWEDGTIYTIDQVKSVVARAALKAGGQGTRYEIVIDGRTSYLFYERNPDATSKAPGRWFTERKTAGQT